MTATGYVDPTGDPRKVSVSGDTLTGELLAMDVTPSAPLALAPKSYVDSVAGGGGGSGAVVTSGYVADQGVVTLANVGAVWTVITELDGFTIPAVVGDRITFCPSFLAILAGVNFLDQAVLVGGVPARYASTGGAAPAIQGDPTAYREAADGNIRGLGPFTFVAAPGDISGGVVTFGMVYSGTGTTSTVQAGTNYPFRWTARNDGQ